MFIEFSIKNLATMTYDKSLIFEIELKPSFLSDKKNIVYLFIIFLKFPDMKFEKTVLIRNPS